MEYYCSGCGQVLTRYSATRSDNSPLLTPPVTGVFYDAVPDETGDLWAATRQDALAAAFGPRQPDHDVYNATGVLIGEGRHS